jgi:hypothetical protein
MAFFVPFVSSFLCVLKAVPISKWLPSMAADTSKSPKICLISQLGKEMPDSKHGQLVGRVG